MTKLASNILLVGAVLINVHATIPDHEYGALHDFYNATSGEDWHYGNNPGIAWDFSGGGDPCADEWYGVVCNDTAFSCSGRSCSVTELNVGAINLNGTIPCSISHLSRLFVLYLGSNKLRSSIPRSIAELTDLQYINVRDNSLTGSIPESLGSLSELQFLGLRSNQLTGNIPSSLSNLNKLGGALVDSNMLSGNIPDIFAGLPDLELLTLAGNRLTGTIPSSIGVLAKMTNFVFQRNYLSGSIPTAIVGCVSLSIFVGRDNRLSGSIPSTIGSLSSIVSFDVSINCLTGVIPSSIGLLRNAKSLFLDFNAFSGPIPTTLGGLSSLSSLVLSSNLLTGSVPDSIFQPDLVILNVENNLLSGHVPSTQNSDNLASMSLANNAISGVIPADLLLSPRLRSLHLSNNFLTGTLPSDMGDSSRLSDFVIDTNYISGSLPDGIFEGQMKLLLAHENYLSGPIPELLENSPSTGVGYIYLYRNMLTGTIPTFEKFTAMIYLLLYDNWLTGNIPQTLGDLDILTHVQVQNNKLSGNPAVRFKSILINTVDLSRNKFSGSIPPELFANTHLKNLVLSINCFEGEISPALCQPNSTLKMLSMDGLRAGEGCVGSEDVHLVSKVYAPTMEGSIPECLFSFPKLQALNIAGNGLFSQVISRLPKGSQLTNLTLSHNRLTGTINPELQHWPFRILDLSFNRLTGNLAHMNELLFSNEEYELVLNSSAVTYSSHIILKENRLSGDLPSSFRHADTIDVLVGNLFSCHNLPVDDPNYDYYSCASSNLDNAMVTWAVCIPLVFVIVFAVNAGYVFRSYKQRNNLQGNFLFEYRHFLEKQLKDILKYVAITTPSKNLQSVMPQLSMFIMLLYELRRIAVTASTFIVVVVGTTVLVLKAVGHNDWKHIYPTYVDQYSWVWSVAYVAGYHTATLFAVIWCFSMCYYAYVASIHAWDRHKVHTTAATGRMSLVAPKRSIAVSIASRNSVPGSNGRYAYLIVFSVVVLDFVVVLLVNGQYVRIMLTDITRAEIFLVQVGLTAFNVSWNKLMSVTIANVTKEATIFLVSFQHFLMLLILLVNNVLAPVFSSIIVDSSCFRSLILGAEEIDSEYQYYGCNEFLLSDGGNVLCTEYTTQSFKTTYKPSYIYNYECTSSVISNYIPILLFVYLVQSILFPLLFAVLSSLNYSSIPGFMTSQLPGFLWPRDTDRVGRKLIPSAELLAGTRSHLAVLFTFGMVSPPLAVAVTCAIVINIYRWQIYIGRYMVYSNFRASMFDVNPMRESNVDTVRNILNHDSYDGRQVIKAEMVTIAKGDSPSEGKCPQNEVDKVPSENVDDCLGNPSSRQRSSVTRSQDYSTVSEYTLVSCTNIENSLTEMSAGYKSCVYLILVVCAIFYSCILLDMSGDEVGFISSLWVYIVMWTTTIMTCSYVFIMGHYQNIHPELRGTLDGM